MGASVSTLSVVECHSKSQWRSQYEASKLSNKLMVIDFTAKWCGPCQRMDPVIHDCATKYTDVQFMKIDVDKLEDVAKQFGVNSMPTFVFLKNGKEIDRIVGANTDELERKIEKHRV